MSDKETVKQECLEKLREAVKYTMTGNGDYSKQVESLSIAYGILNGTITHVTKN